MPRSLRSSTQVSSQPRPCPESSPFPPPLFFWTSLHLAPPVNCRAGLSTTPGRKEVLPTKARGRVLIAALRAPVGRQSRPVVVEEGGRVRARTSGWPLGQPSVRRARRRRHRAARARRGAHGVASCLRRCGGSATGLARCRSAPCPGGAAPAQTPTSCGAAPNGENSLTSGAAC